MFFSTGNNADAGTNTEWFYGFYETKEIFDVRIYVTNVKMVLLAYVKKVSEYDQEIPQSVVL